jgi:hypothetical protein
MRGERLRSFIFPILLAILWVEDLYSSLLRTDILKVAMSSLASSTPF